MPPHRHIEVFQTVMLVGSFTEAARLLRSSQPTVSRMVRELQDMAGFTLFMRRNGMMVPTAEAIALHQEVERSFVGLDRIAERMEQIRHHRTSALRIVAMPVLSASFIPRAIARFSRLHPDVQVTLQVHRSEAIASWVPNEQFDVGFSMLPMEKEGVSAELFCAAPAMCVFRPPHRLEAHDIIRPADLHGENFVGHGPNSFAARALTRVFDDAGVRPRIVANTPLSAIACQMVLEGLGVTLCDAFTASDFQTRGLIAKPFEPSFEFNYGVLLPHKNQNEKLANIFMEICRDNLAERFPAEGGPPGYRARTGP
ncbi:LysR substrate-binding domain-containing protein [Aureimonas altamirensis]|uniref:LysR substrate-binding domain-containing protein n=1 Tax=Aureimonas altamirensis TaxID=370622 RepID=UPI00068EC2D2|nr:LysR substrate-binding domain-containing protein [Aureimonas altamirensis]